VAAGGLTVAILAQRGDHHRRQHAPLRRVAVHGVGTSLEQPRRGTRMGRGDGATLVPDNPPQEE
jgi:hypothetical protein